MTLQELEQLSKAQLIEIILQQQALIAQLQAAVAQLQEQIQRLTQPPKDASNSSVAPSKTRKPNRSGSKPQKKRGPKPGHTGASRTRQAPDAVVECRPASCDRCGADLPQDGGWLLGTSQVVEIPPVQPVVIEARRYGCACPGCGHRQAAPYPAGIVAQWRSSKHAGIGVTCSTCHQAEAGCLPALRLDGGHHRLNQGLRAVPCRRVLPPGRGRGGRAGRERGLPPVPRLHCAGGQERAASRRHLAL